MKSPKNLLLLLLLFPLAFVLSFSTQGASGQSKTRLEKASPGKPSKAEADAAAKIVKPSGQADLYSPSVSVLPGTEPSKPNESAKPLNQTVEPQRQEVMSPCSWTLLILDEIGSYYLISTGVPCLGCNIPNELSQSTPGILGFSHSPSGPWSETLTVYTQLDFSGNGISETFYIKGQSAGVSTFHGQNFWSSFDVDFQVVPCTCPEIPIVP